MGNPYAPPRPDAPGTPRPEGGQRPPGEPGTTPDQGREQPPASLAGPPPGPGDAQRPGGPPGPGLLPPGKEPRTPADIEAVRRSTRQVMCFGMLMLGTILATSLPFPWQLVSIVFGGAAIYFGVRSLVLVRRARLGGLLIPAIAVGLVLTFVTSLSMLGALAMWDTELTHQRCVDGAITISALDRCTTAYDKARAEWTTADLTGS